MNIEIIQTLEFLREIDRYKQIERKIRMPTENGEKREDDAQHSWHMAMMVWLLAPFHEEPIDVLKAVKMSLYHDLGEIDHGDVSAFDPIGRIGKKERELSTMDRLLSILPLTLAQEMRNIWTEYEEGQSPEARYVQAIDKLQPMIQNLISGGRDWKEDAITEAMLRNTKEHLYKPGTVLHAIYNSVIAEGKGRNILQEGLI